MKHVYNKCKMNSTRSRMRDLRGFLRTRHQKHKCLLDNLINKVLYPTAFRVVHQCQRHLRLFHLRIPKCEWQDSPDNYLSLNSTERGFYAQEHTLLLQHPLQDCLQEHTLLHQLQKRMHLLQLRHQVLKHQHQHLRLTQMDFRIMEDSIHTDHPRTSTHGTTATLQMFVLTPLVILLVLCPHHPILVLPRGDPLCQVLPPHNSLLTVIPIAW